MNDKVQHFLVSYAAVVLMFVSFTLIRLFRNWRRRVLIASVLTFAAGLLKEAGDSFWWDWPWCPPCYAEWKDIVADALGVVLAAMGIWMFVLVRQQLTTRGGPASYTSGDESTSPAGGSTLQAAASSAPDGDEEQQNKNNLAITETL